MPSISKQQLIRLQKKLITDEKIGEQFGITRQAVFHLRRKYGIVSSNAKNAVRNEKIIELSAKGLKVADIAVKIGISVTRVYSILRESKVARSSKKKKAK